MVESALTKQFHPPESQQLHIVALRARVRGKEGDLQQLRCDISHLIELVYPDDPPTIRYRTAKDFSIGALTPLSLKEKVLDMNPQTLDDCVAAAQRFETNRKVLDKGTSHILAAGVPDEQPGVSRGWGSKEPPGWAKELFQQQAEILKKLNNLPQPEEWLRERK